MGDTKVGDVMVVTLTPKQMERALELCRQQLATVTDERDEAKARLEQTEVQLAGCSAAALGWSKDPPTPGMYGWSASYGDVLSLRLKYERAMEALEAAEKAAKHAHRQWDKDEEQKASYANTLRAIWKPIEDALAGLRASGEKT